MMIALLAGGCVHRPGASWPYTAVSYAEDNMVFHGVGVRF
jgi:hypothetical protein